jgi:hypothetical protein
MGTQQRSFQLPVRSLQVRSSSSLLESVMKAVLFCAALATFSVAPAFAQNLVARQGDDSVRLSEEACKSELVLSRLEPGMAEEFHAASAVFQGQRFQACWRMMGNAAYLVYEDGDQGIIPADELKPELAA